MRVRFISPSLPRNPLLRLLALAALAVIAIGLLTMGLLVGGIVLASAAIVLAVRRWLSRGKPPPADHPSVIEGEFTVVPPHARAELPRPE
jgi:membrane protein implicated in regulation of membrane protease activity